MLVESKRVSPKKTKANINMDKEKLESKELIKPREKKSTDSGKQPVELQRGKRESSVTSEADAPGDSSIGQDEQNTHKM